MTGLKIGAAALGLMIGVLGGAPASAWKRGPVQVLAVLAGDVTPGVKSSVEDLTVGPDGNIYVSTFGFNIHGAYNQRPRRAFRDLAEREDCQAGITIQGSSPHMLGLAFNPKNGFLLVCDFGAGVLLHVDPVMGRLTVVWNASMSEPRHPLCEGYYT